MISFSEREVLNLTFPIITRLRVTITQADTNLLPAPQTHLTSNKSGQKLILKRCVSKKDGTQTKKKKHFSIQIKTLMAR